MDLGLTGKKAVVTGGSRGIGKAVARRLALEGCDVAICARSEGPLQESASELAKESGRKVIGLTCDTTDYGSIKRFINGAAEGLGGIEILVNGAARVGGARGDVESVDTEEIIRDFTEKVVGYVRCAQQAVPYMKQAGWGRIINVNAIYPGQTITEAGLEQYAERARNEGTTVDALLAAAAERTVIRHLVTADDIGQVVAFLCSPLSIAITGEAIAVSGGASPDVHF